MIKLFETVIDKFKTFAVGQTQIFQTSLSRNQNLKTGTF